MSSSIIKSLCERWDAKTPVAAITTAVDAAFPELRSTRAAVDVRALAAKRGASVRTASINLDGMISALGPGAYLIELNRAHPESRRRFTCAHEIGHTFFFELDHQPYTLSRHRVEDGDLQNLGRSKEEEILCNAAAAEILMPFRPFSNAASNMGLRAKSIIELSRLFKTSLWATARRFVQVMQLKLVAILWERQSHSESYRAAWSVRSLGCAPLGKLFIDRKSPFFRALQSKKDFRGEKWLSLSGPIHEYFVDGVVLQSPDSPKVLTLFILDQLAQSIVAKSTQALPDPVQLPLF